MGICCSDRGRGGSGTRNSASVATCIQAFKQPAKPIGSASGGARLFRLVPTEDSPKSNAGTTCNSKSMDEEWLGKDVAQSFDELEFYDCVLRMQSGEAKLHSWRIFDFLVNYYGVIRSMTCCTSLGSHTRERMVDLLVFRSPLEGFAKPRLLNMEIGPRSSALQYKRGSDVGTVMFARKEGIRIEGFLTPPPSLAAEDPSFDARGWAWGDCQQRRAKRLPLHRLRMDEALSAFMDLRDATSKDCPWPAERSNTAGVDSDGNAADAVSAKFLGPAEYAELALLTLVRELASLVRACADVPFPQKWVGSSVGLLVETAAAPPREGPVDPQAWVATRVKVRLFGWNRSTVSCSLDSIPAAEYEDHSALWQIYQDSVAWILWEASRLYFHAFCAHAWTDLRFEVCETLHKGDDVILGVAELRLSKEATNGTLSLQLANGRKHGPACHPEKPLPEVVVTVSYGSCPSPSRLSGFWRIQVDRAANLPLSKAPPTTNAAAPPSAPSSRSGPRGSMFVVVEVQEHTSLGNRRTSQRTRGVPSSLDPAWGDEFEFPVVLPEQENARAEAGRPSAGVGQLCDALGCKPGEAAVDGLAKHMPPPVSLGTAISKTNEESTQLAAMGQLAFMMELRDSWSNSPGSLLGTRPS